MINNDRRGPWIEGVRKHMQDSGERQSDNQYRPVITIEHRMIDSLVEATAFAKSPVVVGDVGVRGGFDSAWNVFGRQCQLVGFEADPHECARLQATQAAVQTEKASNKPKTLIVEHALWENPGCLKLNITADASASSVFEPNMDFFGRLPNPTANRVVGTVEFQATTLDAWHRETGMCLDVLKLDVQGAELAILRGGQNSLRSSILAVIVEVEFISLYKQQPLFSDLDPVLRSWGLSLFDLDVRRWRRRNLSPEFDGLRVGQLIYADALYLRDPVAYESRPWLENATSVSLLKLASLAELFALPDFAVEVLSMAAGRGLLDAATAGHLSQLALMDRIVGCHDRSGILQRKVVSGP